MTTPARPEGREADDGWLPTSANINALPYPIRKYIHDLETRCDPAGDIRELTIARDTIRAMEAARSIPLPFPREPGREWKNELDHELLSRIIDVGELPREDFDLEIVEAVLVTLEEIYGGE